MDQFIVKKQSMVHLIAMHIDKHSDLRVFRKKYFWKLQNRPVKLRYSGKNSIEIRADVEAKYNSNWTQNLEKLSEDMKKNLEKTSGIKVKKLTLSVRDVFYEKADVK